MKIKRIEIICKRCGNTQDHYYQEVKIRNGVREMTMEPCINCLEASCKDGYEDGYSDGQKDGQKDGYKEGYDEGYKEGYDEGYKEGYDDGEMKND